MWAHFAGGAMGALLFASGLLTRGVSRTGVSGEEPSGPIPDSGRRVPASPGIKLAGAGAGILLATGLIVALVAGRPFALISEAPTKRVNLEELGISLELPENLSKKVFDAPAGTELLFGDTLSEPMTISAWSMPLPAVPTPDELRSELDTMKKTLPTPKHSRPLAAPQEFDSNGDTGFEVCYKFPSGLVLERAFLFRKAMLIRVEVVRWPEFRKAAPRGSAKRIVGTAKQL
jgi:hypothetical protein